MGPRVVGADPLRREAVWYGLQDFALPLLPGAQSALDIALWDIAAQRADVPLHQLLGGARTRLPAYASTPLRAEADAYVAFVGDLLERGFRAVKFHAWCEADRDLEMLRKVHAAHGGSGMAMMHDAEQRYDRHSALRVARELDAMGFRWLEAPLPDHDLEGYADLRRRVGVPILAGGNDIVDLLAVGNALRLAVGWPDSTSPSLVGSRGPRWSRWLRAPGSGPSFELGYTPIQAANLHLGLGMRALACSSSRSRPSRTSLPWRTPTDPADGHVSADRPRPGRCGRLGTDGGRHARPFVCEA